jgi:uracil-DNA glycosylase family 4
MSEQEHPSDPKDELLGLVRSARALLEWHRDLGSDGLEASGDPGLTARTERREAAASVAPRERSNDLATRERPNDLAPPRSASATAEPVTSLGPTRDRPRFVSPFEKAERSPPPRDAVAVTSALPRDLVPTSVVLSAEERVRRLEVIEHAVAECSRCALAPTRTTTVFARGNPSAEILFVGEGPGEDEDREGKPFVGRAGQLLDKMIGAMGLSERDVYICNVVKCRPPKNRTPEPIEMASCLPYLVEQIEIVEPRVIVALGATALRGLLGSTEGITRARGQWKLYRGSIPVMPTFHPSYVLRQPTREVKGAVWSDLQQVLRHLGKPLPKRSE